MAALSRGAVASRAHPPRGLVAGLYERRAQTSRYAGRTRGRVPRSASDEVRQAGLYAVDSGTVVRRAGMVRGERQRPRYRIVLAGFDTEHRSLVDLGWREWWYRGGFLQGGYANVGHRQHNQHQRLWLSPHCLGAEKGRLRWRCLADLSRRGTLTPHPHRPAIRAALARGDISIAP